MKSYRTITAAAAAAAMVVGGTQARAQPPVSICDALSLYANGATTGLCQNLSPTNQNLWVCELTLNDPDVHLTFNAGAALHVTVRTPRGVPTCQGNSTLTGTYPAVPGNLLRRAAVPPPVQPAVVCAVSIDNYIQRLIAVPQLPAAAGQNRVQTAILNAQHAGRVAPAVAQTYINTAAANGC